VTAAQPATPAPPAPPSALAPKPHPPRWLPWAAVALSLGFGLALLLVLLQADRPPIEGPPTWAEVAPGKELHAWRWLVIHHSATREGDTERFDAEQRRDRGWEGIGYHFVIGNGNGMPLGAIDPTWRWWRQYHGAHAGSEPAQHPYNLDGIGICLVGDYEQDQPDPLLLAQTARLCALLIRHVPSLGGPQCIIGHRDVPGKETLCPGRNLHLDQLRAQVAAELARPEAP
jgi:hypothetical protein